MFLVDCKGHPTELLITRNASSNEICLLYLCLYTVAFNLNLLITSLIGHIIMFAGDGTHGEKGQCDRDSLKKLSKLHIA